MVDDDRLADVLADWHERRERGEALTSTDLIREHPEIADALRSHFDLLGALDLAFPTAGHSEPVFPERIGEYRLIREIGRGGMGVVYEAEQTSMQRRVALKILLPVATFHRGAVHRFEREARAAGRLHHTNIVPIHAMGQEAGFWFYAMDLVQGPSLSEVVRRIRELPAGAPSAPSPLGTTTGTHEHFVRIAEAAAGVAEALHGAHQAGIVHRDVKPQNLLLDADGTLKIVDFGLAHLEGDGPTLTLTGQMLGTPYYMSPEQARARELRLDHRTDVYSLGATLYELLTLKVPFTGANVQEICSQIIAEEPLAPRRVNGRVPRDLETIVLKAMEKDREKRYATAHELSRDLRRFADGVPIEARRISGIERVWRRVKRQKVRAGLTVAVLAVAALAAVFAWRARKTADHARDLEYARLCATAEEILPRYLRMLPGLVDSEVSAAYEEARRLYSEAIALVPERVEAWLGRSLVPGGALDERLADLRAARVRGLSDRSFRAIRAFHSIGSKEAVPAEDGLLREAVESPTEAYCLACYAAAVGRTPDQGRLLSLAVDLSEPGEWSHYLARRRRASLRGKRQDYWGALEDFSAIAQVGPAGSRAQIQVLLAATWWRLGHAERAATAFEEAVEGAHRLGTPTAWLTLCLLCRQTRQLDWHDAASQRALAALGELPDLLVERALGRGQAGHPEESIPLCRRAIALDPENAEAHRVLGDVLRETRQPEEAVEILERAERMKPRSAAILSAKGLALAASGRTGDAIDAMRHVVELSPRDGMAWKHMGAFLEHEGRLEDAFDAYSRSVELVPTYFMVRSRRWRTMRKLGREEEAISDMERTATAPPRGAWGRYVAGHTFLLLNRHEEALSAFEEALRLDSSEFTFLGSRGCALRALGRYEEALADFEACVALDPSGHGAGDAHHLRASVFLKQHQRDRAAEALLVAVELKPADETIWRDLRSFMKWHPSETDVLETLDRVATRHPHLAAPLIARGQYHFVDRHAPEKALSDLERALEMTPEDDALRRLKIRALVDLRRFAEALSEQDRRIAADPAQGASHAYRAMLLAELGQFEKGTAALHRARELDPAGASTLEFTARTCLLMGRFEDAYSAIGSYFAKGDPLVWSYLLARCQRARGKETIARAMATVHATAIAMGRGRRDCPKAAYVCAVAGRADQARSILEGVDALGRAVDRYEVARVHAVLGTREAALASLVSAVDAGMTRPSRAVADVDFADLAEDPRYQALVTKMIRRLEREE